jgi:hypothetical protein
MMNIIAYRVLKSFSFPSSCAVQSRGKKEKLNVEKRELKENENHVALMHSDAVQLCGATFFVLTARHSIYVKYVGVTRLALYFFM